MHGETLAGVLLASGRLRCEEAAGCGDPASHTEPPASTDCRTHRTLCSDQAGKCQHGDLQLSARDHRDRFKNGAHHASLQDYKRRTITPGPRSQSWRRCQILRLKVSRRPGYCRTERGRQSQPLQMTAPDRRICSNRVRLPSLSHLESSSVSMSGSGTGMNATFSFFGDGALTPTSFKIGPLMSLAEKKLQRDVRSRGVVRYLQCGSFGN